MSQNSNNPFKGLGVALITPYKNDGEVDYDALRKLVSRQVEKGADFLCVLGTTAETPTLSEEEKANIREVVVDEVKGRVPLLVGVGGNNTRKTCEFLQTTNLNGYQGVLVVCPFYNKPSQEGLFQHFVAVSAATPLPVVIYNIPGRTGVNLEGDTLLRIVESCPNVIAIKEAAGKLEQLVHYISLCPDKLSVLCGDDALAFEAVKAGAAGVISVVGNAFPYTFSSMLHAIENEDYKRARQINSRLLVLYDLLMRDGNPSGIKCLLSLFGLVENRLRLPLVPVSASTHKNIETFAKLMPIDE